MKGHKTVHQDVRYNNMKIILYRHARPVVSNNEIILGSDFPDWVKRYNDSEICETYNQTQKEKEVISSVLKRSWKTAELFGEKIVKISELNEAEVPLIHFPQVPLKAKYWLVIARLLWLFGYQKNCESFKDAKYRIEKLLDIIENYLKNHVEVVIIGHGFLNLMLKNQLKKHGWSIKTKTRNKFLDYSVFTKTEQ